MLQAILQLPLLLGRKLAKLRIAFQRAALLRRREILIVAQPGAGVSRLIGRRLIPRRLIFWRLIFWRLVPRRLIPRKVIRTIVALRMLTGVALVRLRSLLRPGRRSLGMRWWLLALRLWLGRTGMGIGKSEHGQQQ